MTPVQTYARIAGILLLISFIGGTFGELIVPSAVIVPGKRRSRAAAKPGIPAKLFARANQRARLLLHLRLRDGHRAVHGVLWSGVTNPRLLIYRSTYIPRFVGVLLMITGVAFIVKNLTLVLAPAYSWDLLLLPAPLMVVALTVWFLWKGVDVQKWNACVLAMRAISDPSLT